MDDEQKNKVVMELITTGAVLFFYWVSMTPEWKLEMYKNAILERLRPVAEQVNLKHRAELEKFRQQISEYEHEMRRRYGGKSS